MLLLSLTNPKITDLEQQSLSLNLQLIHFDILQLLQLHSLRSIFPHYWHVNFT